MTPTVDTLPTPDHRAVPTAASASRGAVLITGASSGIGRATALRLARAGFLTFGAVRNDTDGASLTYDSNGAVRPIRLDVTDPEQIHTATGLLTRELGNRGLAGLVNNAGIGLTGPLELLSRPFPRPAGGQPGRTAGPHPGTAAVAASRTRPSGQHRQCRRTHHHALRRAAQREQIRPRRTQ